MILASTLANIYKLTTAVFPHIPQVYLIIHAADFVHFRIFTARRYASALYAVVVCLSSVCLSHAGIVSKRAVILCSWEGNRRSGTWILLLFTKITSIAV